jgi:AI-2 transport protein TqsA
MTIEPERAPRPNLDAPILMATLLAGGAIYLLRDIIAPLALAIFLLIVVSELARRIKQVAPQLPRRLALALSLGVIVAAFALMSWIIIDNLTGLLANAEGHIARLDSILAAIGQRLGLALPPNIEGLLQRIEWTRAAGIMLAWVQNGLSTSMFVLIYLAFMMASRRNFGRKIAILNTRKGGVRETANILERIRGAVESYVWVQTTTGLMIASASWLVMWALGLPQPLFWAFVIFVASYVPIVGGALGILAPALFGLLEFDDLTRPLLLLVALQAIGVFVGNVIQPRMQGRILNVDPVVVLLSLALWGALLGATGAFLSTPLTVTAMAILAEFKKTRWLAIFLSSDGNPYPTRPTKQERGR